MVELFGQNNTNLNLLRKSFPEVTFTSRGNSVKLSGEKKYAQRAKKQIEIMIGLLKNHDELPKQMVKDLLDGGNPFEHKISERNAKALVHGPNGKIIKAKTRNQKKLIEASEVNDIVFAVGPAGTGKTYTAVALAVRALRNRVIKKIILTRPAVEAGENLGFLPGDLKEKVDPYLRPLYDALEDMIPAEKLNQFMQNRTIEVAPLAFMRGRTLDNAFVILDEAQNCTTMQIKMFLTRLGPSAKCIVTGDLSQIDLPYNVRSGLGKAIDLLGDLDGISVTRLSGEDVVRHRLVRAIIQAYDESDAEMRAKRLAEKEAREQKAKDMAENSPN